MMKILRKMIQNFNALTTKKYLILAAIAMMTLAACTKLEDTAPPRKITFETASYRPQTKAEVSIMSEFQSFKCKAFLYAENGENAFFPVQYMFGGTAGINGYETISPYKSDNTAWTSNDATSTVAYWAPSHDYYWPKGAKSYMNFISWYDEGGTNPDTATEQSLVWSGYQVDENDNLLFADEAWRYNGNPNSIYHKEGEGESYKAVPMLFHHALSKLCIKAAVTQTSKANSTGGTKLTTWDVTLSNIKLLGVYDTGTLTLSNGDPINDNPSVTTHKTKAWTGGWETQGSRTTYNMNDVTAPLNTADSEVGPTTLLVERSVLPQSVSDNDNLKLSFDYLISTKFDGTEYSHEKIHAEVKLKDFSGAIGEWEMNKKITYTISINPETTVIRIDPAMVDWIPNVSGGTYNIQ
ncbi:MAG: fimbrillin family protein [Bacteroidales bacterium]|nr:fimbrillin family protein [Bacteroidales bacterium]